MNWYLKRLVRMQPREVISRLRTAARLPRDWYRYRTGGGPTSPAGLHAIPQPFPVHPHSEGASVDRLRIFDLDFPASFDFDWHRDYRHDKLAARVFGPMLDTRDPTLVGDVKYIWEINRHQHLSALAYS